VTLTEKPVDSNELERVVSVITTMQETIDTLSQAVEKNTEAVLAASRVQAINTRTLLTLLKTQRTPAAVSMANTPTDVPDEGLLEARLSALRDGTWRPGEDGTDLGDVPGT
jgi:hypothetical protein